MEKFKINPITHLEKGFKPIVASIDRKFLPYPFYKNIEPERYKNAVDVDSSADLSYYRQNKMRNGGEETYVISDVSTKDKYTVGMYDCTGIIVVGEALDSKENISIISHQDPKKFLTSRLIDSFVKDLADSVRNVIDASKKGSVDAVIVGGNYYDEKNTDFQNYKKSINLINGVLSKELNFEPIVLTGPKISTDSTDMYFDTKNRRAYILMPEQLKNIIYHDFKPSNVEEQIENITAAKRDGSIS